MKRIMPVCQHCIMLLLFLSCLLSACKKMDTAETSVQPRPPVTDFFDLPKDAPSAIRKTVAEFARQDKITGFVKGMVASEGMPLWGKSVIEVRKKSTIPTAGFDGDGGFEIEDTLVFTPILEEDSLSVNGFFMSKITGDSVELHLFRGNDYDNYSHGSLRSNSLTAERVSLELMKMNYQVFGYTEFIVTDSLLFADDTDIDSNLVHRRIKLKIDQQNGFAGNTTSTNNFLVYTIELCNWGSCPQIERTTPGGGGTPHCRTCWTVTILHDDFPDGSPNPTAGGEGGGMGTPPANGNCTGNTNCRESSRILDGRFPCGDCGPGPIVVVPLPDPSDFNPYIADTVIVGSSLRTNYPCVKKIIDSLNTYSNINALTQVALHEIFGVNQKIQLSFIEDGSLPISEDGHTDTGNMGLTDSIYRTTVHLNTRMLSHATQEYIAAVIIHESIHAYIQYCNHQYLTGQMDSTAFKNMFPLYWPPRTMYQTNGIYYYQMGNSPQHRAMAANLTGIMKEALVHLYPNTHLATSRRDSVYTAFVWGGLEETPSFLTRSDSIFIFAMNSMGRDTSTRVPYNVFSNGVMVGTHTQYDSHNLSLSKGCH